jgi:hypothetical protein
MKNAKANSTLKMPQESGTKIRTDRKKERQFSSASISSDSPTPFYFNRVVWVKNHKKPKSRK